jgi:serine/threonine protein kinase
MYGIEGLLAGRTLVDRYLIREVIGRGGMGAVYRAHDQRLGREVAVKVVTVAAPDAAAHATLVSRFHREARAAARLRHPNIVAVYDFGRDADLGLDFLVMELLRGEDLAIRLARQGPPPLATSVQILHDAARGLAAGHRAGLIHRDVKPGNLYLESDDGEGRLRVKVLDFGIAELASAGDATLTQLTVVGRSPFSPAFASPEQLRGEIRLSPATDVFSLGAVGYWLVTGRRAFTETDPRKMVVEVSRAAADLRGRDIPAPEWLRDALRRALAPHPDDRFPDADALAAALESHLESDAPSLIQRASRPWVSDRRDAAASNQMTRADFAPDPIAARAGLPSDLPGSSRAPAPVQGSHPPVPVRRSGWIARSARAVVDFVLTGGSLALFTAAWFGVVSGLQSGDLDLVYGGALASVVLTPLALHRVLRRRGSFRLALFGSIIGSVASVYLLARDGEIGAVLATMFMAQVLLSGGAELLSRGTPPPLVRTNQEVM